MLERGHRRGRKLCREYGVKVSHDAGGAYPGVENLMPYVDWSDSLRGIRPAR